MIPVVLQQFSRVPAVGDVKTRLQVVLSAADACAVHVELARATTEQLLSSGLGPVELWFDRTDPGGAQVEKLLTHGVDGPLVQQGADLGERMYRALARGLDRAEKVLLTGSDCPGLDRRYLQQALTALDDVSVVLGPAEDGGFVLVACREQHPQMFDGVVWGSGKVLVQTLAALDAVGLRYALLDTRYDVDRPEDLARWRRESSQA